MQLEKKKLVVQVQEEKKSVCLLFGGRKARSSVVEVYPSNPI